ncbi:MAG TPA: PAS domain S-box protein [Acidobacteriaceae bacterium]|nr:PAS domain S-box protein [Acidobacteriaceae bacterium]
MIDSPEAPPKLLDMKTSIAEDPRLLLAAIIDSSEDAIISKDLNGVITSWNKAAQHMYGYTPEEIVGQSILRLIPNELHSEEDEILRKLRAGQRLEHYETTRVTKAGRRIEVSLTISPIKDSTGRVIGSSKIARDITERKQMERSLVQSEKLAAAGRMAATVAHEINNPLEAVLNLIFLARESCARESETHEYLEAAERELERVSHIARQTLGFYRDTGTPVDVVIDELLKNVLSVYRSKLMSKGIAVEYRLEARRPLMASRGELFQVFSNIIANAIDALEPGRLLEVETQQVAEAGTAGIQIVIRDEGCGIEAEHLTRIFEPFFTTKEKHGTGIGLWVAKQLVGKRGGRIEVTSNTAAGHSGTEVCIFFPFDDPAGESNAEFFGRSSIKT